MVFVIGRIIDAFPNLILNLMLRWGKKQNKREMG